MTCDEKAFPFLETAGLGGTQREESGLGKADAFHFIVFCAVSPGVMTVGPPQRTPDNQAPVA